MRSGRGRNRAVLAINSATLAMNVPLCILLISEFGLPGAAAALVISELFQATLLWITASRDERSIVGPSLGTATAGGVALACTGAALGMGRPELAVVGAVAVALLVAYGARWHHPAPAVASLDERVMNEVDVVILTWNDGAVLDGAVASAVAQQGVCTHVTVVDNGSTSPARVGDGRVRLIRSIENLGVGRGRNRGVAACTAPFVCFLDSDARLHPGALAQLLAPLLEDETIGLSAPVYAGQPPTASAGRAPTLLRKLQRALNRTELYEATPAQGTGRYWDVDFAIGACQLFRRTAFDAIGGLDGSAPFGPEDVDFCLRLQDAG